MPEVEITLGNGRTDILAELPRFSTLDMAGSAGGRDRIWDVSQTGRFKIEPAEFVDNPEHTTPDVLRYLLRSEMCRYPAMSYAVLHNAKLVGIRLILDQQNRYFRDFVPGYIHDEMVRTKQLPETVGAIAKSTFDSVRHIPGDSLFVSVGSPSISHFFIEGLIHLTPIGDRKPKLIVPSRTKDAFVQLMVLAGHSRDAVIMRPPYFDPARPNHVPECLSFDRLIVPRYTSIICPSHMGLFDRIKRDVPPAGKERIYITRTDARAHRAILNEEDVTEMLVRKGFDIINCSEISEVQKIGLFRSAKLVVQPGGAAVFNTLFTDALDLQLILGGGGRYDAFTRHISGLKQAKYAFFMTPDFLSFDAAQLGTNNDFVVDVPRLEARVDKILTA